MDEAKRKRLEDVGFRIGTVAEFLGLTPAQSELIEIKLVLTDALRKQRETRCLSQAELAEKIGSSQSRVAKMEAGDPHVSLDLMIRALLAAGMTRPELADAIAGRGPKESVAGALPALPAENGRGENGTGRKRAQKTPVQTAPV